MRKVYKVAGLILALLLVFLFMQSSKISQATTGFYVSNGRLYDANGNDFIMRGVNHAHTWYTHQTSSFAHIKNAGANTVRVVLSSGDRWTRNDAGDVANVIALCKQNRLICMLEVHDTTGYGEEGAAATLDEAVDYWLSIQSVLTGEEAYVLINIGNEPFGNSGYQAWAADTSAAITRLRNAGFAHTIVVDAPNWGQDWTFTMRDNAAAVFASDPEANTVFSIHMYGVFDTAAEIQNYLNTFVNAGLPIIVGEFGHNHSDGNPDEDAILAHTEALGLGYLGWSWSGNSGGVEYLDMVINFDPNNMSAWGDRLFNGTNGIVETAVEASVFGTPIPTNTPGGPTATATAAPPTATSAPPTATSIPPTATTAPPTATPGTGSGCSVNYAIQNDWGSGFIANVVITNNGTSSINGWALDFTFPGNQTITNLWGGMVNQVGSSVTVNNADWNSMIGGNGTVSFGFQGGYSGANSSPSNFTLNGVVCN